MHQTKQYTQKYYSNIISQYVKIIPKIVIKLYLIYKKKKKTRCKNMWIENVVVFHICNKCWNVKKIKKILQSTFAITFQAFFKEHNQ